MPCAEHPRARGENGAELGLNAIQSGTSPRTRGKLQGSLGQMCAERNIPAHAGKTMLARRLAQQIEEHPRARGENLGV